MKLRYTRRAFADRAGILDYLQRKSPVGARNVTARLDAAIDHLLHQPLSGYPTDVPEVRVLLVGRYPYKVFYRVATDAVEILHIRHTSRDAPERL